MALKVVLVGAAVHPHLHLGLHHPDDGEGGLVDLHRLAHHLHGAEEVLRQLVAQEDDAPLLLEVALVQEASPGLRKLVADLAEVGLHAADARVDRLRSHGEAAAAGVFGAHQLDLGHSGAQQGRVVVAEVHWPAGGQAFPGLLRGAGPEHGNALPHAPRVLVERALQALAEGEQQDDRERAPGDGQDGQDHALALPGGVVGEEPQDQAELGAEVLHASFKAWTGSSSDARRAGK
jgi:hypothetical protein